MTNEHHSRTFASELRSLVATTRVLAEYASGTGDKRSASILDSAAALLEATVASRLTLSAVSVDDGTLLLSGQMAEVSP